MHSFKDKVQTKFRNKFVDLNASLEYNMSVKARAFTGDFYG